MAARPNIAERKKATTRFSKTKPPPPVLFVGLALDIEP
jgi:hypothetical protein